MISFKTSFRTPLFVLILYVIILLSRIFEDQIVLSGNKYLSISILQLIVFVIPSVIFCRLRGTGYSSKLNFVPFSPGKLGCAVLASVLIIVGSAVIRIFQNAVFGITSFEFSMYDGFLPEKPVSSFLFIAVAFAVVPALTEEFVFRSVVITEYSYGGYGAVISTAVSSLLSSMIFFSFSRLPVFFLCGIVCSIVTYVTGSSLAASVSHVLFNIYGIFGEPYILKVVINPTSKIILVFTLLTLTLIVAVIFIGECEHILHKNAMNCVPSPSYLLKRSADGNTPDISATDDAEYGKRSVMLGEKTKKFIEVFCSPSFLMCIIVFTVAAFAMR